MNSPSAGEGSPSGIEIHVEIAPLSDAPTQGTLPVTGAAVPSLVVLLAVVLVAAGVALRSRFKPRGSER